MSDQHLTTIIKETGIYSVFLSAHFESTYLMWYFFIGHKEHIPELLAAE